MTQEEKAKRYDEAIIRGSRLWESDMITRENYEYIFPEVKESKNDMIRKDCLKYLDWEYHRCSHDEDKIKIEKCIVWLKKQGEKKPVISDDALREGIAHFGITQYQIDNWLKKYIDIEKQDEQKSTDKVEPKFKVGYWYIDNEDGTIFQIVKVLSDTYIYKTNEGKEYSCSHYSLENDATLWTIQDAKDGDVIYSRHNTESFEWIGIFKSLDKENKRVFLYGFWHDMAKSFSVCRNEAFVLYDDFSPATKEQRELLFQKMKEAGYKWDSCSKKIINNR